MNIRLNPGESLMIQTENGVVQVSYLHDISGDLSDNVSVDVSYDRTKTTAKVERLNTPFPPFMGGDTLTTACSVFLYGKI